MKLALCVSGGLLAAGLGLSSGPALAGAGFGYPGPGYGYGPLPGPYGMPPPMYGAPYGYGQPPLPRRAPATGAPPEPATAQGAAAAEPAPAPPALPPAKPGQDDAAATPALVTIAQMRFDPPRITVKKGTRVTWRQDDRMPHTVTANDGSFSSPRLTGGGEYTRTFEQAGTYAYYCGLHPSMRGEVQVVD